MVQSKGRSVVPSRFFLPQLIWAAVKELVEEEGKEADEEAEREANQEDLATWQRSDVAS